MLIFTPSSIPKTILILWISYQLISDDLLPLAQASSMSRKQFDESYARSTFWCMIPGVGNGTIMDVLKRKGADTFVRPQTIVQVHCFPGFHVESGASEAQCRQNGVWSKHLGMCAVTRSELDIASLQLRNPFTGEFYGPQHNFASFPRGPKMKMNDAIIYQQRPKAAARRTKSGRRLKMEPLLKCGVPKRHENAAGSSSVGNTVAESSYPWIARIQLWVPPNTASFCSAVLISNKWLLTSASCLLRRPVRRNLVYLSSYNRANVGNNPGEMVLEYRDVVMHPNFEIQYPYYFNYALVELNQTIEYNDNVNPICLPDQTDQCEESNKFNSPFHRARIDECDSVLTAGWGLSSIGWDLGFPNELRHTKVGLVSRQKCASSVDGELLPNEMCAATIAGHDACIGDAGGPLMCKKNGHYSILGIKSESADIFCGRKAKPGVYNRVCSVIPWIRHVINSTH